MRVALVSPLSESVPPSLYGGTERIVSYLTEELVAQGHDVTLFASGDSKTSARLVPAVRRSLRLDAGCRDPLAHHIVLLDLVRERAADFDLIHFHLDHLHYPLMRLLRVPHVTTLHGRLDIPDLVPLYERFDDVPLISISRSQRAPLPHVNWVGNVPHGIPEKLYALQEAPRDYLAFIGRIAPEKRPDRAIEIARRCGLELRMAAKVDRVDEVYFREHIVPRLTPGVTLIGEIGDAEKQSFLGQARALLFPIDWPEPFGLVMLEAMACGTPTIAFRCGSVPEVLEQGVTGYIVDSVEEAVAVVEGLDAFDRKRCRNVFEQRFTVARMAQDYAQIYSTLCLASELVEQTAVTAMGA